MLQGATGIAEIIRVINESKSRMTQLKQELAASTNYFRHGYQDENVLLPMVLEGQSDSIGFTFMRYKTNSGAIVWATATARVVAAEQRVGLQIGLANGRKYFAGFRKGWWG